MSIDSALDKVKDFADLKHFAEVQHTTIVHLTHQVKKLEEEKEHLKKLLESIPLATSNLEIVSDSETIAKIQLEKLKETSFQREFTLEEARRFEIFTKILSSETSKPKDIKANLKKLSDTDLLKLLDDK